MFFLPMAQQRAQHQYAIHTRFMSVRAYYASKGMELLKITDDRKTGKTWFLVKRKTTIPRVSR